MPENNQPAPPADNQPVDDNQNQEEPADEIQEVSDAIEAIAGGVKGGLSKNSDAHAALEAPAAEEDEEGSQKSDDPEIDQDDEDKDQDPGADKTKATPAENAKDKVAAPPAPAEKDETEPEADPAGVFADNKADNPGDFKPGDYSFEITTTDGKSHKISTPEDAEGFGALLDDDPAIIVASQFAKFNSKLAVMEQGIAADKREFDAKKADFDAQQQLDDNRTQMITNVDSGFKYLQSQGKLTAVPTELNTGSVRWEDHRDNEAIKQRLDILAYMNKDNEERLTAGLEPSFDAVSAYNAMRLENMEKTAGQTSKRQVTDRQRKGSLVGAPSAYEPHGQTKGSIVGEGGSLNDLLRDFE